MHVFVWASVCEFRGRNSFKLGKNVKPGKIRNFQTWKNDNNNNKFPE